MSGRSPIEEGLDFFWDGVTLVGKSEEGIQAIKNAMAKHAWPFIDQLCTWADGSPENGAIVNFAGDFERLDKAVAVLAHHAPVESQYS
ncbi:MAG: hypothetical protein WAV40_04975 [Microgenomates group bacterium]